MEFLFNKNKTLNKVLGLLIILSAVLIPFSSINARGESAARTMGDLNIGDRVVDPSWQWEHKTGHNYLGKGEIRPVTWIVVARNHYDGLPEHVTLLAEGFIAFFIYDDFHGSQNQLGSNSWEENTRLRKFLNSADKSAVEYPGVGFYNTFSNNFKEAVLTTDVPNKTWNGEDYVSQDKVFIPSQTELGGGDKGTHPIGATFPYFEDSETANERRKTRLPGAENYAMNSPSNQDFVFERFGYPSTEVYWTRSPSNHDFISVRFSYPVTAENEDGFDDSFWPAMFNIGARPVLNVSPDILVTASVNSKGHYEIIWEQDVLTKTPYLFITLAALALIAFLIVTILIRSRSATGKT